ncbi:MAG: glutamate-5-semialdehyde dehydrogenase [Acidimicrobiaceae bacterium]|nr:glutamate-5-semialdehyde dehydrogenase [Acidimicrobiaceae bacterium]
MTNALAEQGRKVREASRTLAQASNDRRVSVLLRVADALKNREDELLLINAEEVDDYVESGAGKDRLTLSSQRVTAMADALREIAGSSDPLFESFDASVRPNGLRVERLRVPLGVIGVVYENRPNVTSDVAGLCVRSGNAAYLRGSSSAQRSNQFIVDLWREALVDEGLPEDGVALVQDTSHQAAVSFMQLTEVLDCLIPRGGPSLIAAMREHARVPFVLDGDGNCHVYVDASADIDQAVRIVANAKTSRPGVCNAAETVLVNEIVAQEFLSALARAVPQVELRGDERTRAVLPGASVASEDDYEREFLDLILAVRVVDSLDEAIEHVARYGTGHSEAIVTQDEVNAEEWIRRVDAAAVLVNASTRFVDGGELGLGGEVGISTQKLHARGPMGLRELTCLKWVLRGDGQVR